MLLRQLETQSATAKARASLIARRTTLVNTTEKVQTRLIGFARARKTKSLQSQQSLRKSPALTKATLAPENPTSAAN
jgi:hypothetical protein